MTKRPAEAFPLDVACDVGSDGWNIINKRGQTLLQMHCQGSAVIVMDASNLLHRAAERHLRKSRRESDETAKAWHAGIAAGLKRGIRELRHAAHRIEHGGAE